MQGKSAGVAHIEHAGNRVSVTLESGAAGWRLGFVKLARPSPATRRTFIPDGYSGDLITSG